MLQATQRLTRAILAPPPPPVLSCPVLSPSPHASSRGQAASHGNGNAHRGEESRLTENQNTNMKKYESPQGQGQLIIKMTRIFIFLSTLSYRCFPRLQTQTPVNAQAVQNQGPDAAHTGELLSCAREEVSNPLVTTFIANTTCRELPLKHATTERPLPQTRFLKVNSNSKRN